MMENLQNLILSMNNAPISSSTKATLSNSFLDAAKQSIRSGLSAK